MLTRRRPALTFHRPARGEELLRVDELVKSFGDKHVFKGLTLSVYAGEVLSVIGGSGAGKSVLLKCLIGLMRPEAGRVLVEGQDVVQLPEEDLVEVRRHVAMVFQGGALFDSLPVGENIAYPLREQFPRMRDAELAERVARTLALVGLPGVELLYPADLSGGMKKRVALARAIATEPEAVLWDEPTTGLDPVATEGINALITSLREQFGRTSVVVTHDMASAFSVSDRIAMIAGGKVVQVGTPEEMRHSNAPEVRAFLDPRRRELPASPGEARP
jgi:phospholipid/cholesterol/gamma-HCH transport system ATP-binding protein